MHTLLAWFLGGFKQTSTKIVLACKESGSGSPPKSRLNKSTLGGGYNKTSSMFTPIPRKMIQFWLAHLFQIGLVQPQPMYHSWHLIAIPSMYGSIFLQFTLKNQPKSCWVNIPVSQSHGWCLGGLTWPAPSTTIAQDCRKLGVFVGKHELSQVGSPLDADGSPMGFLDP